MNLVGVKGVLKAWMLKSSSIIVTTITFRKSQSIIIVTFDFRKITLGQCNKADCEENHIG